MIQLRSLVLVCLVVQLSVAPPVTQNKKDDKSNEISDNEELGDVMEYQRYLREVVQVLESDPVFKEKLEKAHENELRTGKIADNLEFVNHNVRTRLDELKREELERLRHLARKEYNLRNGLDLDHLKIAEHLDHANSHTFEVEDLKKLIAKTTKDLAEADRKRRAQFKEHEMQVKFEEQEHLKEMSEAERKKYEAELQAIKEKHRNHEPVHHPGSKQQLMDVWEEQDMMGDEFNPRTFFHLHDVDSNGVWDQDEVKALFLRELDKLYAQGATHEELLKRTEEMERMREHVYNEADVNRDGFISYEEFLEQTKKPAFQQDEGWDSLDEQQIYTHEEYEAFTRRRQEEIQKMIAQGIPPPHQGNIPVHPDSFPPQYVNVPGQGPVPPQNYQQQNQHAPVQQQYENHQAQFVQPQPVPVAHQQQQQHQQQQHQQQQYQNHVPVQNAHQDQVAQQQQYRPQVPQQPIQGHAPNQQHYQGQVPQQQYNYPDPAQQQQYQGQVPPQQQQQQQYQAQVPPQQQQYQGQVQPQQQQQQQYQGQVPPQQQHQQQPQAPPYQPEHQQNTANQAPSAAAPQQVHPNQPQQPAQQASQAAPAPPPPPPQPAVQRNSINAAGKA